MTTTSLTDIDASAPLTRWQDVRRNFWVLVAGFLGVGTGVLTFAGYTIGPSIPFFQDQLGWDRATSSSLYSISGVVAGVFGILVGLLIDRFSLRAVVATSVALLAVSQVAVALTIGNGNATVVQLIFALASIGGAGTTIVAYSRAIVGRFTSARGLALGLMGLGTGAASIIYPLLVTSLIPVIGLSGMYLVLAVLALLPLPFVLATFQSHKEVRLTGEDVVLKGRARYRVLRTSVFWRLFIIFTLLGAFSGTVASQAVAALGDRGIAPLEAAGALSLLGVGSILGRIVSGFLLDRFPATRVAAVLFIVAVPVLPSVLWGPVALVYVTALLTGLAIGSESDFLAFYLSRRIGVANLTFTMAMVYFGFTVLGAPMPLIAGIVYDATGSYDVIALVLTGAMVVAVVLILTLPSVRPIRSGRKGDALAPAELPAQAIPVEN